MNVRAMISTLLFVLCIGMQVEQWIDPPVHQHIRLGSLAGHRRAAQPFHPLHAFDFLTRFLPHWQTRPPEPAKSLPPQRPFDPKNPAGIDFDFIHIPKDRPAIYRMAMMLWRREMGRRNAEIRKSVRAAQALDGYIYFGNEKGNEAWNQTIPRSSGPWEPQLSSFPATGAGGNDWLSSGRIGGGDGSQQ